LLTGTEIKARRPVPMVRASDFFRSLVKTADGRWIFAGVLNGYDQSSTFQNTNIMYTDMTYAQMRVECVAVSDFSAGCGLIISNNLQINQSFHHFYGVKFF
jgi:hypothetical protein